MNQTELGRRAGYSRSMISMLLSGTKRPSLSGAFRLESITGIPAKLWWRGTPRQLKREVKKWIDRN